MRRVCPARRLVRPPAASTATGCWYWTPMPLLGAAGLATPPLTFHQTLNFVATSGHPKRLWTGQPAQSRINGQLGSKRLTLGQHFIISWVWPTRPNSTAGGAPASRSLASCWIWMGSATSPTKRICILTLKCHYFAEAGETAMFCQRKTAVFPLSLLAFHVHLPCDLAGSMGADGYQWPVYYFYPPMAGFGLDLAGAMGTELMEKPGHRGRFSCRGDVTRRLQIHTFCSAMLLAKLCTFPHRQITMPRAMLFIRFPFKNQN